jgi:hypothetical protein
MFRTKEGCLGLAPRTTESGDRICLLRGGHTPYVLRSTGRPKEYILIGECFVYGHMAGEAWNLEKCHSISII